MKMGLYTIYDEVAKQSSKVFEATNNGIAMRLFEQSNKENPYKEETHLMSIGTVEKDTMVITAWEPKEITPEDLFADAEGEEPNITEQIEQAMEKMR